MARVVGFARGKDSRYSEKNPPPAKKKSPVKKKTTKRSKK